MSEGVAIPTSTMALELTYYKRQYLRLIDDCSPDIGLHAWAENATICGCGLAQWVPVSMEDWEVTVGGGDE